MLLQKLFAKYLVFRANTPITVLLVGTQRLDGSNVWHLKGDSDEQASATVLSKNSCMFVFNSLANNGYI